MQISPAKAEAAPDVRRGLKVLTAIWRRALFLPVFREDLVALGLAGFERALELVVHVVFLGTLGVDLGVARVALRLDLRVLGGLAGELLVALRVTLGVAVVAGRVDPLVANRLALDLVVALGLAGLAQRLGHVAERLLRGVLVGLLGAVGVGAVALGVRVCGGRGDPLGR